MTNPAARLSVAPPPAPRRPRNRPDGPKAPKHLATATKKWWREVVENYELEPHHVRLLTMAAESWDRAQQAREQLAKDGPIYRDRFGAPRKHPSVSIEENARIAFARLIRELDLDGEPLPDPRPRRR
jgi:P27 family predicted phage terminase small subunit